MTQPANHGWEANAAARVWRASLPGGLRRSSALRGSWIFVRSAAAYVLLFLGTFLLPAWWMRTACLLLTPLIVGALFVIGHDAAHQSLTPVRWLNRILGRLSMLPAYHPYTSWCYAHNTLHHGGTCLKQKQPDFPPFSKDEFDRLPFRRQLLERIYRTPPGVGLCYTVEFFWRFLLFPSKERRAPHTASFHFDRLLVLAFAAAQGSAVYLLSARPQHSVVPDGIYAVAAILTPWFVWIYCMGVVSFVQHTHPMTAWYDREDEWRYYHVQLRSTTHMLLPWPAGAILHNIMDHPAHHIDPSIPLYALPAAQRILEQQAADHSVVSKLTWSEYLRICRTCKLYDYQRHRWLDFEGHPTTETHELAVCRATPSQGAG